MALRFSLRNCFHGCGAGAKRRKDARKDGAKKEINGEQKRETEYTDKKENQIFLIYK
jgi:hypothetical protein